MEKLNLIPLNHEQFAIVDEEDFEAVSALSWFHYPDDKTSYAVRKIKKPGGTSCSLAMHTYIFMIQGIQIPPRHSVDHINGNGLDNRRANLRIVTIQQNALNRKLTIANTSGYRGVMWHKKSKRWRATLFTNGKLHHIGAFKDKIEAAKARDAKAKELHGEFAVLNFPEEVQNA
jgi:hypothetical protein